MKRDPHLPSPEVCDWLLSQEWEGPESHVTIRDGARVIDFILNEEELEALREDAKARAGDGAE